MRVSNIYGISYYLYPKVLSPINKSVNGFTTEQVNNKILFFKGSIPDVELLYKIKSEQELRELYTPIMEVLSFKLMYTYTLDNKIKLIKKIPVESISANFLSDGTIKWCAIILEDDRTLKNDNIILYTDSIGLWGDDNKIVIVKSLSGAAGDINTFKDLSIISRDISTSEGI